MRAVGSPLDRSHTCVKTSCVGVEADSVQAVDMTLQHIVWLAPTCHTREPPGSYAEQQNNIRTTELRGEQHGAERPTTPPVLERWLPDFRIPARLLCTTSLVEHAPSRSQRRTGGRVRAYSCLNPPHLLALTQMPPGTPQDARSDHCDGWGPWPWEAYCAFQSRARRQDGRSKSPTDGRTGRSGGRSDRRSAGRSVGLGRSSTRPGDAGGSDASGTLDCR